MAFEFNPLSNNLEIIHNKLVSKTTTSGDAFTLTSDGTTETLTPSRNNLKIIKTLGGGGENYFSLTTSAVSGLAEMAATFAGAGVNLQLSADSSANHTDAFVFSPDGSYGANYQVFCANTRAEINLFCEQIGVTESSFFVSTRANPAVPLSASERLWFVDNTATTRWSVTLNGDMYAYRHIVSPNGNLSMRTATSTATANLATAGTGRPGIQFVIASSVREPLWTTFDGAFGWEMFAENSANGDLFMRTNNATNRYRFMRDTSRFEVGGSLAAGVLGSEELSINGLAHIDAGMSINTGGGSTSPDNYFRVFGNAGDAGVPYLYVDPSATAGGVGVFTTTVSGGLLNYAGGTLNLDKTGAAGSGYAGTGIDCSAARVHLIDWYGESGAYSSTAGPGSVFGFGHQVDNVTTGDMAIFRKDGEVGTGLIVQYFERSTGFVGFGSGFTFAGSDPDSQVHVGGTFHVNSTSQFDGDITLTTGTDLILGTSGAGTRIGTSTTQLLGFWNATPVARPAAYTPSNVTTDRSYDANSTTVDELADVVGTLIADLQSIGLIG